MLGSAGLTRLVRVVYPGLLGERDPAASVPVVAPRVAVHIDSTPTGAEVYRDGMLIGTTPCDVRLPPGAQRLDLVRAGSQKTALRVDPRPGMQYAVTLAPVAAPPPSP
jgi:hypothetical protein